MNTMKSDSPVSSQSDNDEIKALRLLASSRHHVYLAGSTKDSQAYALKAYFYENNQISNAFLQEKKFKGLTHHNLITLVDSVSKKKDQMKNFFSYNLFEYAPFGNLAELMVDTRAFEDKILVRTIFHQIVAGVEYLHSNGISHMDLKLTNLLIGDDYKIKIIDFEYAHFEDEYRTHGRGTAGYRAPEVRNHSVFNHKAADIYSLGIILFCLYTGNFPYFERKEVGGYNFEAMVLNQDPDFWDAHVEVTKIPEIRSEEFKKLFWSMVKKNPSDRISIKDLKSSDWFNGEVYGTEAYKAAMERFLSAE